MLRSTRRAYHVEFDRNKCIGCLLCVKNCPPQALGDRKRETFPAPFLADPSKCTGCLICEENCPVRAVTREVADVTGLRMIGVSDACR